MTVRMRADLVEMGMLIPVFIDVSDDECIYLTAEEVEGAVLLNDNDDDNSNEYYYEHIQLKDGRMVYAIGIDLEQEQ